jgi:Recombinase zinc beta ribbon domain
LWKFKERQWVKVPGTNKRQPRARNASEVMMSDRPELRIVERGLWQEVSARLAATKAKHGGATGRGGPRGEMTYKRAPYLFSGILVCRDCGAPMTMMGGLKYRYYRCQQNKTKGNAVCANSTSIREDILRPQLLDTIRDRLLSDDGVAYTRRRAAEDLRDSSKKLDAELRDRKERLLRTEEKMAGLVDFIANGERVQYIVQTLRDLETFAIQEREAIKDLEAMASAPLKLPSIAEIEHQVRDLDRRLQQDPEAAREQLRRWLRDGSIKIGPREDGKIVAEGGLLPLMVVEDVSTPKKVLPETNPMVSGRYTIVAGAGYHLSTTRNRSGSSSERRSKTKLDAADLAFLDYLIEKAIETFLPRPRWG